MRVLHASALPYRDDRGCTVQPSYMHQTTSLAFLGMLE